MSAGTVAVLRGNPTYRRILLYSLPLAVSGLFMNLEQPVISSGVSRLPDPEIGLAALGIAIAIPVWVEAPIIMMLDAATARCVDRRSYRLLRSYALIWCAIMLVAMMLISFVEPVQRVVLGSLLGVSDQVASEALPALALFIPWPSFVAWRRLHQGVLIRQGQTRIIGYAVAIRLAVAAVFAAVAVATGWVSGAVMGAAAMSVGAGLEALAVYLYARPIIRQELQEESPEGDGVESLRVFNRYYLPLVGSSLFLNMISPLIAAGLARSVNPTLSLAVWPVAYSLVMTVGASLSGLQQVAVRLGTEPDTARMTKRILLAAGIGLSLFLLAANAVGLTAIVLERVIGVSDRIRDAAMTSIWIMTPMPFIVALRSLERGRLVRFGETRTVQLAAGLTLLILATVMLGINRFVSVEGFVLAAIAFTLASITEVLVLGRRARSRERSIRLAADGPLARPARG